MDMEGLMEDPSVHSLYEYIKIEASTENGKTLCNFKSVLNKLDCHVIQNKHVNDFTILQHACKEGLTEFAKLIL